MKILDCRQQSAEWLAARCGIPTASRFCDIVTPTGRAVDGRTRRIYLLELVAERLTGTACRHYVGPDAERGTLLEPRARAWYELKTGTNVKQVGFVLADSGEWGCSPDGLVDETKRGIEIKCPGRVALLDIIDSHVPQPDHTLQMQASMWICGLPQWDYVVWTDDPRLPCDTWTVEKSASLHEAFAEIIPAFCEDVRVVEEHMRERGGIPHEDRAAVEAQFDGVIPWEQQPPPQ